MVHKLAQTGQTALKERLAISILYRPASPAQPGPPVGRPAVIKFTPLHQHIGFASVTMPVYHTVLFLSTAPPRRTGRSHFNRSLRGARLWRRAIPGRAVGDCSVARKRRLLLPRDRSGFFDSAWLRGRRPPPGRGLGAMEKLAMTRSPGQVRLSWRTARQLLSNPGHRGTMGMRCQVGHAEPRRKHEA